jgi:hypothetical protein
LTVVSEAYMHELPSIRRNRGEFKGAWIIGLGLVSALVVAGAVLCGRLGIRSKEDVVGYYAMAREKYHPIWRDLAWRRIKKGDSIERVLQRHSPSGREDYGPYTALRYDGGGGLVVWAKDGKLMGAETWGHGWKHTFFATPSEERARDQAYSAYMQQKRLEFQAFQIHRVITGGQDVFLAWVIEGHEVPHHPTDSQEMTAQLIAIYGREYLEASGMMTRHELSVEVTEVLHGDVQPGMILTFPDGECGDLRPGDPDPVFLHVDDQRLFYPRYAAQELYMTVPREALDWYRSLTADQVQELEAKCLAERAKREALEASRK